MAQLRIHAAAWNGTRSSGYPATHQAKRFRLRASSAPVSSATQSADEPLQEIRPAQHLVTVKDFLTNAAQLRETFDENFREQRKVTDARFCWDYWHVPGQYTQIRTPAQDYFNETDYNALEAALLDYGKEKLGCVGITPLWLSYYVNGCYQELHCDNVHGPWAFVLSLTDWEGRSFTGGETMLLSDTTLNFWSSFATDTVIERRDLMTLVEPNFNQLTLFDPRIPHGVREVHGTREPTHARIVLHGWFVEPEMFVEGELSYEEAKEAVLACTDIFSDVAQKLPEATGMLTLRIAVEASGEVAGVSLLTDTLVARPWDVRENDAAAARAVVQHAAVACFSGHKYPEKGGKSTVTMPLIFD